MSGQLLRRDGPDFARFSPRVLAQYYRGEFAAATAVNLAYRGSVIIWLVTGLIQPIVLIIVWRTVAGPTGVVGGYTADRFVSYFAIMMLVDHLTFIWLMWEFEWRVREGQFSPLLLRPIHPIHKDIIATTSYKVVGLAAVLPAAVIMIIAFGGDLGGITVGRLLAAVPALVGAMVLRFILEWVLALSAFWLTKVSALNNLYFSIRTFLSGGFAPLSVLPGVVATIATWSPFPWSQAFVVNVVMGETTGSDVLIGYAAQAGWIVVMLVVLRFVWSRAVRRYSAVGT
ncbi:ABC transporter permease [Microlunatus soli]|uniref:ABC-2 type transport system permease protein n=1 Tax=Microlunatus soli TaxID=630515 RepID=A0A1H1ZWX1_9ACTN|nr:ABC-2 family transporter protein [Microlunatus soli]SDT38190.1 ABC-2 type transport system permease protein [Microlunatus soli]